MNTEDAKKILLDAINHAFKQGAYDLNDANLISASLFVLAPAPKLEVVEEEDGKEA